MNRSTRMRKAESSNFTEIQRPTQIWRIVVWLMVMGLAGLMWFGAIQQLVLGQPWGTRPAPDAVLAVSWAFAGVLLPGLLLLTRLHTRIDREGIHVRFHPFHRRWRVWRYEDIAAAEARSYSPLGEFGGWGIRFGASGTAYTMAGTEGVQLTLRSGRRVLIGTRDPLGFMRSFEEARSSSGARTLDQQNSP